MLHPYRYYVASRLEDRDKAKYVISLLPEDWVCTFDWTQYPLSETPQDFVRTAQAEVEGVRTSNLLILILPGARGSHTELGVALGCQIPVWLIGHDLSEHPCGFWYHSLVQEWFATPEDMRLRLRFPVTYRKRALTSST